MASNSFSSSANPGSMAPNSSSSQVVASDTISRAGKLTSQASKAPNVEVKSIPLKPTVTGRSKLKNVSADVRNLLIKARDKGVSSLKSIGPSKPAPKHVPIWKGKNKHKSGRTLHKLVKKLHVDHLLAPGPIPNPAETPVLTKPSMLEALPTEMKFKILHFIPNFAALSSLVHASPQFHHAYVAIRLPVLQKITWIEMINRNINLFSLNDFFEVGVRCNRAQWRVMQPKLGRLIMDCRAYARRNSRIKLEDQTWYPRLTIQQCVLLLQILDYVGWTIVGRPGFRTGRPDRMDISKRSSYYLLNFSRETMASVICIRANAATLEFWSKRE